LKGDGLPQSDPEDKTMMLKHIWTQILASGLSNAILNALFTWLTNRQMVFTPYSGAAVDTFFTTGFVSCLVTLPTAHFTHRAIAAGLPQIEEENKLVNSLPRRSVPLWLAIWLFFFVLFELLLFLVLKAAGLEGIGFLPLIIGKFFVYGLMGGFLGAFVAFRCLQPEKAMNQERV
jgi:hypothetical protein